MKTEVIKPSSDITISFHGAVLWMQGPRLTPQPIQNDKGILLYNGDIFDDSWSLDVSDTHIVLDNLTKKSVSTKL